MYKGTVLIFLSQLYSYIFSQLYSYWYINFVRKFMEISLENLYVDFGA